MRKHNYNYIMAALIAIMSFGFVASANADTSQTFTPVVAVQSVPVANTAAVDVPVASAASGTYQRFLPGGLPTTSPKAAVTAVKGYAALNESYGKVLATQTGSQTFNASDYEAVGWGTASANTNNSALSGSGTTVATDGGVGVKTVRIRNTKTGLLVDVMVRCGNPRLQKGTVKVVKHVKVRKVLRIYVNKKFTVAKTIICVPSGQQVTGSVTGYVRGWFTTKVKGWTTGAKLYYSQQVDLKVTNTLKLKCGAAAVPTPPPALTCQMQGKATDLNGNCVGQSNSSSESAEVANKCDQTHTTTSSQCNTVINQTTIQINANCSQVVFINGDGNIVSTETPVCVNAPQPPPNTVTFVSTMSANATVNANATVSCPPGSTTATATATASGSASATITVTSTVSQSDADDKASKAAATKANADAQVTAHANASAAASVQCQKKTPPPPPVDHAPQITCVYPAHVYVKGTVYIWCESTDSDSDAISVNIVSNNSAGHVSGTIPVNVRWDNTACPSGTTCTRGSFWGDNVGNANVTATASANGKSATSTGAFPVLADDFGSLAAPQSSTTVPTNQV